MAVDGDNTGVPDQFTKMSMNEYPSSFDGKQDIEKERMQDITDNEHNDDESETESAKEYAVEKVLAHRINKEGKLQYLLKWEDWSSEYNTWEGQENIFADKLIKQYWKKEELRRNESPFLKKGFESEQSKKPNGNDKKRFSPHPLDGTSPKRHHRMININDSSDEDPTSISVTMEGKQQETQTLQSTTTRSTQAQQLYSPPPLFLQRTEPPEDLFDPDPKVSHDWDNDSINVEFLELGDQGIVGCLKWKSGSRSWHCLDELHAKCPRKMLEFYKENMRPEPEEKKDYKALLKARSARRARPRW